MAEEQFTTITPKNGPQEHLWTRLFRIQGLAEILHPAAIRMKSYQAKRLPKLP